MPKWAGEKLDHLRILWPMTDIHVVEIAARLGETPGAVRHAAHDHRLPYRRPDKRAQIARALELYTSTKRTVPDIAAECGIAVKTLFNAAQKTNVTRRAPSKRRQRLVTSREVLLVRRLAEGGKMTPAEIAMRLGWGDAQRRVVDLMYRNGIKLPREAFRRAVSLSWRKRATRWEAEDREVYRALYVAGVWMCDMAAYFGRSLAAMRSYRLVMKIPARTPINRRVRPNAELIAAAARLRFRGHDVRDIGLGLWRIDGVTVDERQVMGRLTYSDSRKAA